MLIKEILLSYYNTQALYVASELKIADLLIKKPKDIYYLAKQVNVNQEKLYRVMRFLASMGIFNELPNKVFINNKESQYLLTANDYCLNDFIKLHAEYFYKSASNLLEGIQDKGIPFKLEFGDNVWQFLEKNNDINKVFTNAMSQNSNIYVESLLNVYDFSKYKKIVDLGGGVGNLLVAILNKYKDTSGICLDLPMLEIRANNLINKENLAERCSYVTGNFLDDIPTNADLYILKAILHGKDDQLCKDILLNCIQVLPERGKILVIDRVIISHDKSYKDGCINDINMLNVSAGYDRTLNEFTSLFLDVNLKIQNLYQIEQSLFAIELSR
ncbi:methyltransferase [Francisella adeliensis]|uniref:Uncharacterized protein n=1 Tax=Francisella adeliensis TaxID=2007306 RepID=A0A2Z4XYS7_9GAMM|nr:methyltransferase [Francisella adeliensis]AXA33910.1 hypothetical protein CDH04_05525 [Francisella adeliensis]MBK2085815.1 hypothetical protein [Francisella adeliensis]MBK2097693.1 hypothetical protein [Francisella adeliensis]QIW12147.1 hypothetical protein FZC43_05530 [Francisella adeliensis]QIW14021.1 hypothetical protein FZC44_05530 [Francisella adeliensis]